MRWMVVRVAGPSMVPTLYDGDHLLARRGQRATSGDVVLAHFADTGAEILVVKRAVRPVAGGWWVASDNPYAGGDSRTHGPATILARVVWRYWPLLRRRS